MEIVSKAEKVSRSMTKRELHGILMGSSLRSFKPPHGTKGILVTWIRGGTEYAVQQHHSDHHVKMKKISNYRREEVCVLYFYYYEMVNVETEVMDKKEDDAKITTIPKSSSVSDDTMAEQEPEASLKRQGPDSRTVVLAPEKKKQKIHYVENNQIEDYLREFHYYMNRRRKISLEFPDTWKKDSQLFYQSMRALRIHYYNEKKKNLPMLFNIDYKHDCGALACLRTARIYKVDSDTSNIEEESIDPKLWKEIDLADEAEIKQFAEEKTFKKIHRMQISEGMIEIDGVWIRKKKRYPGGELKMKSRMCARGCFDSQKHQLTTRSTTYSDKTVATSCCVYGSKKELEVRISGHWWSLPKRLLFRGDSKITTETWYTSTREKGCSVPSCECLETSRKVWPTVWHWRGQHLQLWTSVLEAHLRLEWCSLGLAVGSTWVCSCWRSYSK